MPEPFTKQALPFGSWPSPVTAALVAGKSLRLGQPRVHRGAVCWTETRPDEQGRTTLVRHTPAEGCVDLVPAPYSVQSRAHEYGGGAYTMHDGTAWFVNKHDQCIYVVHENSIRRLTEPSTCCFADLEYDAHHVRLLAVCEDHDPQLPEARTTLVAISCTDGSITTLQTGCDFYSSPRPSPDGARLAWLEWNHPDMPWDATRLCIGAVNAHELVEDVQCIAGGPGESVLQPLWRNESELIFASDRTDWWNLYAWRDGKSRALHPVDAEFALPHWVFGMRTFGLRDADTLICASTRDGMWRVGELAINTGAYRAIDLPFTQVEHVHAENGSAVLLAASATRFAGVALLDAGNNLHELRRTADTVLDPALLTPPEPVEFATGDGDTAHALYYAPSHPHYCGESGTAPPLLVKAHGGPTAATSSALDLKIRYWTSRGFAVLDVNYRGSTGYGRRYRERLYGEWGVVDVNDCIRGASEIAARGLADPQRLLISGSSAGGFTVLAALTFHDVFAAGASYYGIGDLAAAMRDTAKFESRYGDRLVGPLPATAAVWRARSPLFHADRLARPVIFFQGLDDRVVPSDQSERMFEALRGNGVTTAYLPFPNEGHGFRKGETIEAALEAEYAFYCQVLGITPAPGPAHGAP